MVRALEGLQRRQEDMRRALEEMRREIAAGRQVLIDLHETAQAQSQALLRALDRLA